MFCPGDRCLEDDTRSERPVEANHETFREFLVADPRTSTGMWHESLDEAKWWYTAIFDSSEKFGTRNGNWICHELTDDQRLQRVVACTSLIFRNRHFEWIRKVIAGDDKVLFLINHSRYNKWVVAGKALGPDVKTSLREENDAVGLLVVLLSCVLGASKRWCHSDHRHLNSPDGTCQSCTARRHKHPKKIRFLEDHGRLHVAFQMRMKLVELGWKVLPYPLIHLDRVDLEQDLNPNPHSSTGAALNSCQKYGSKWTIVVVI